MVAAARVRKLKSHERRVSFIKIFDHSDIKDPSYVKTKATVDE